MEGGIAGGADAHLVAQVIVDAVDSDDGRLHVLVGEDAQFFVSQSQSLTEAELVALYKELIGIDTAAAVGTTL
jgi:hypothetical protein